MPLAQSTDSVLMIRPSRFFPNPETAADNSFQQPARAIDRERIAFAARGEFDTAVSILRSHGVNVTVLDDSPMPEKPDAVFPNNWISTHHDGRIVLYPMFSPARRRERRADVVDALRRHYRVTEVLDYSALEEREQCLEGTGSLVLDHVHHVAYVSLSRRSHPEVLRRFCADFDYEPVTFTSVDRNGEPIYHTNVMLCIGTDFVLAGLACLPDRGERSRVRECLQQSGRDVIELAPEQIEEFAGNALELQTEEGRLLALSRRALVALSNAQVTRIEQRARLLALDLPTIELAGGSARCMMATIHLPSAQSSKYATTSETIAGACRAPLASKSAHGTGS